jgi:kynurenine 3-monooxygenase
MRDRVDDPDFLLQRELEQALQKRHPGRFVPHYTMVTFMLIPYAVALERSDIQREILVAATQGLDSLEQVDWPAVDAAVEKRLAPLVDAA